MEMLKIKNYRFGFDWAGLALFLAIMIPNFIWFAVPAPEDVLRSESVTGTVDRIGSVCQVLMVAGLCFITNRNDPGLKASGRTAGTAACILLYGICWLLYYLGKTGKAVLLGLAVFPCAAFLLYSWERKNYIAAVFAGAFSVCHLIYAFVNFVLRAEP